MKQISELERSVAFTADAHKMLENERGVLVGYSGGADSSALLSVLAGLCRERGIYLAAIHINHGIRGAEADRDETLCRAECERMGIDFTAVRFDIPTLASLEKCGLEETARKYRYAAFRERVASDERLTCIATAHNADDNAETLIMNLVRGSGIDGLCGIPHVRDEGGVRLIRPLLDTPRAVITAYCEEKRIQYIFDSTNADTAYRRNFIRHELIPKLCELNPSFIKSASRTAENLSCERDCLRLEAERFLAENAVCGKISLSALNNTHDAIASRAIVMLFSRFGDATLERVHIRDILALAGLGREGSSVSLPGGISAVIEHRSLCFKKKSAHIPEFCRELRFGANNFDDLGFGIFMAKIGDNDEGLQKDNETLQNIYKLAIQALVNSDTINHTLYARSRMQGDSYVFGGMTRRLKKLYNDRGLTVDERARLPIITDGDGIVFVPGFPVADRSKPHGEAVKIIYYYNGDNNEQRH